MHQCHQDTRSKQPAPGLLSDSRGLDDFMGLSDPSWLLRSLKCEDRGSQMVAQVSSSSDTWTVI